MLWVFFIHNYLKDIYSMSHFHFCLPWLESCQWFLYVPPFFLLKYYCVVIQYHTNCNNSYLCYINPCFGKKIYLNTIYIYQYLGIFFLPETSACDINKANVFYLNSQRNKNFSGSFQPDQEKTCNICPFQRFQYFPKT